MEEIKFTAYQKMANKLLEKYGIRADPSVDVEKLAEAMKVNIMILPNQYDLRIEYLNFRRSTVPVPEYLKQFNRYGGKEFVFISEKLSPMTRISSVSTILILSFGINGYFDSDDGFKDMYPEGGFYRLHSTLSQIYSDIPGMHEIMICLRMPSNDIKTYFIMKGLSSDTILNDDNKLRDFCTHFIVQLPDAVLRLKYFKKFGC